MIRRVFLAFLIFGVTGCGDDGTGLENVIGTYLLETIDEAYLSERTGRLPPKLMAHVDAGLKLVLDL